MRFNINELQPKSVDELRNLFSSISKTKTSIILEGDFFLPWYRFADVAKALVWLPRHISEISFHIDYHYDLEHITDEFSNQYETYAKRSIGNGLKYYILSLPNSINSLKFYTHSHWYHHNETTVCAELADIVSNLPAHIESLDLGNLELFPGLFFEKNKVSFYNTPFMKMFDALTLLENIPSSVKILGIGKLELGKLNSVDHQAAFCAIPRELETLRLHDNELAKLSEKAINSFFKSLSYNIKTLDLSNNQLNKMPVKKFGLFLSKTPRHIRKLILSDNELFTIDPKEFAFIISQLPDTLEELDIGENRLLEWEFNDLSHFLHALPANITSLRICQNRINRYQNNPFDLRTESPSLSLEELSARLGCLPETIKRLDLSNCKLGISVSDFILLLTKLSKTIEELDLGMNDFHKFPREDLGYLLAKLPPQIKVLKLNGNKLGTMELDSLKFVLANLSPDIRELDVSQTGLDRLPYVNIRAIWSYLPNTVKTLVTESNEFALRNDGALAPNMNLSQTGLFKTQKRFYNQQEFGKWRLLMMQWVLSGQLTWDNASIILNYVIGSMNINEYAHMRQILSQSIISSVPPRQHTRADEIKCLNVVDERIKLLKADDYYLDLSRCGLNRLETLTMRNNFIAKLIKLPQKINYVNLRGNGFLQDELSELIFMNLIKNFPKQIDNLDLSDNDFESKSAEKLEELFMSLFGKVNYVTLENETPISPELQIAKRKWPKSYFEIANGIQDHTELALKFLDDYTKKDSPFTRFFSLHLNRHHTVEAARLVDYIKRGLIPKEDLFFELERIKPDNPIGSYAKRQGFIFYHPIPKINEKNQTADLDVEEFGNYECQKRA